VRSARPSAQAAGSVIEAVGHEIAEELRCVPQGQPTQKPVILKLMTPASSAILQRVKAPRATHCTFKPALRGVLLIVSGMTPAVGPNIVLKRLHAHVAQGPEPVGSRHICIRG